MNRKYFSYPVQLTILVLLFFPSPAAAWKCGHRIHAGPIDCGEFEDKKKKVMRVESGRKSVVARWYPLQTWLTDEAWDGQRGPLHGIRIQNHLPHDIPIFLRSRKEFNAFLQSAPEESEISTCEVIDGVLYYEHCVDEQHRFQPCPTHKGTYALRRQYRCHGADNSCAGICVTGHRNNQTHVISTLLISAGR